MSNMFFLHLSNVLLCVLISVAYPTGILACSYLVCDKNVFTDRNHPKVVLTRSMFVGSIGFILLLTLSPKFSATDWMHDFVIPMSVWMTLLTPLVIWNSIEALDANRSALYNALSIISCLGVFSNDFDRYYIRSFLIV